jgi:membrane protease YdiL (CAAX protease family)
VIPGGREGDGPGAAASEGAAARGPAPWLFFAAVLAWTWTCLGAAAARGAPLSDPVTAGLALAGGLGPLAVSCTLVALGFRDPRLYPDLLAFLRRSLDPRRLPLRCVLLVLALAALLALGPVVVDPQARAQGWFRPGPAAFLAIGLVLGTLEEPGWRGYAQEGLQRRMPVLAASLLVGVVWAAWHLPLFWISGTYQAGLGVGTAAFWAFVVALVAGSPVYAWLYNAAGRLAVAPALYHGLGNVARELVPDAAVAAEVGVEVALALAVSALAWRLMKRRCPSRA